MSCIKFLFEVKSHENFAFCWNFEFGLADFGVTGQLKEQQKTHTVIGTPFWMAPEVIQEVGHDYKVKFYFVFECVICFDFQSK
jgi:serine/threonine protein kinase